MKQRVQHVSMRTTSATRPWQRRGRGCSGIGCASTRMILPPLRLDLHEIAAFV